MNTINQATIENEFTMALQEYEKGLRSYAFFKVRNFDTSLDLVQDTFMKAWNYIMKGGKVCTMKAFLYHILNHLIIDHYRKRKTTSLDALCAEGFEPSAGDPSRLLNALDAKDALLLIARLPEKDQKVMSMRYVDDLSLEQISNATGASKNTIAVQIHRGLEKLKAFYSN